MWNINKWKFFFEKGSVHRDMALPFPELKVWSLYMTTLFITHID